MCMDHCKWRILDTIHAVIPCFLCRWWLELWMVHKAVNKCFKLHSEFPIQFVFYPHYSASYDRIAKIANCTVAYLCTNYIWVTWVCILLQDKLNEAQKQAILRTADACLSADRKICMIQRPPGKLGFGCYSMARHSCNKVTTSRNPRNSCIIISRAVIIKVCSIQNGNTVLKCNPVMFIRVWDCKFWWVFLHIYLIFSFLWRTLLLVETHHCEPADTRLQILWTEQPNSKLVPYPRTQEQS